MRKRYKILLIMIAAIIIFIGYKKYFFSFDSLGTGTYFKGPYDSPTGKYTANSYYKTYGGAAGGVMVWVTINNHDKHQSKTVYYGEGKSNFDIKWEDEDTIYIQNNDGQAYPDSDASIALKAGKEIFDESGRACDSWIMKNAYKTCYRSN